MMLLVNGSMSVVCLSDNIKQGVNEYAPTEFDNLYAEFSEWCSNNEEDKPSKKMVKEALKTYGNLNPSMDYQLVKKKNDNLPNGSESKPRFNLIITRIIIFYKIIMVKTFRKKLRKTKRYYKRGR